MKKLHFKLTLLSDIIINQRAATEGNQKTLDFIPGSSLLGVAAGKLYNNISTDESFLFFHSGKVRFGDAHPLVANRRALKVPASWYKKKDDIGDQELFIHYGMPEDGLRDNGNPLQVKQYRDDFMILTEGKMVSKVEIKKHFAIKSAYDSIKRRSEDAKMFGYESLQAGSEWCFSIEVDEDVPLELCNQLQKAFTGKRRIGRSSTAQYGFVEIEAIKELSSGFGLWDKPRSRETDMDMVFIYAESRLIFFDGYGQPTFTPSAAQLGFSEGQISQSMSQVRTFQYAPYNNKRHTREADRIGIEKGSVFCITGISSSAREIWVGSYQNEGFGKVLINPEFLEYYDNLEGKAVYSFSAEKAFSNSIELSNHTVKIDSTPILNYLKNQKVLKQDMEFIYSKVNQFVKDNSDNFKDGVFASQWGTIRSLAIQFRDSSRLKDNLIGREGGYLKHGVAADKWSERGRLRSLEKFIDGFRDKESLISEAIINLSAEMAKKCRRN